MAAGSAAAAQDSPQSSAPTFGQQLTLGWSALGAADGSVAAAAGASADPLSQVEGTGGSLAGSAKYVRRSRQTSFEAGVLGATRYYDGNSQLNSINFLGDVGIATTLGRVTLLTASQQVTRQPYQLVFVSAVAAAPPPATPGIAGDAALATRYSTSSNSVVAASERIGTSSSLDVAFAFRRTDVSGQAQPTISRNVTTAFGHHLSRHATVKIGYDLAASVDGVRADDPAVVTHNVDGGFELTRPLSDTRSEKLSFGGGTTAVLDHGATRYRLSGDAAYARNVTRTWLGNISYHRGVSFLEGFSGPSDVDTVQLRFAGMVTRRINLALSGSVTTGQVGVAVSTAGYNTCLGTAVASVPLRRTLSLTTRYDYYAYDFSHDAVMPVGLGHTLHRQTIQIGLTGVFALRR